MSDDDRPDDEPADDREDSDAPADDPFDDEAFDGDPSDEADGPFETADADEVDDPFAALGEGVEDDTVPGGGPETAETAEASSRADPAPSAPEDDPFAELDLDADDAATEGDPFESMETGDVGEEDVWEALDEGTSVGAADAADLDRAAAGSDAAGGAGARAADAAPGAGPTGDERVLDKRSYCQQCPHFSEPPETACTHEGTEIVESVDFSRFRVRNCPMVDANDPAFDDE